MVCELNGACAGLPSMQRLVKQSAAAREWHCLVLANTQRVTETPAALQAARAVPIAAATPRFQHAAAAPRVLPPVVAAQALRAMALATRCTHRHARDRQRARRPGRAAQQAHRQEETAHCACSAK